MTAIEEISNVAREWWFWLLLILLVLGVLFFGYLIYRAKDKIAEFLLSVPLGVLATIVLNLILIPYILPEGMHIFGKIAVIASVSSIGYPTFIFFLKNVVVKAAKKMIQFQIIRSGRRKG